MAKQSVLGAPSAPAASAHRSGFPMSQDFTFTCSSGMILPTYKQFLNIGEEVSGIPRAFIRTEPLLAPAMADLDVFVDVFFVPMRHIISMFDSWLTQVSDAPSSLWSTASWKNHLPVLKAYDNNAFSWVTPTIFNTVQMLNPDLEVSSTFWNKSVTFGFGLHRLIQHLGYNAQSVFSYGDGAQGSDWDYTTFPPDSLIPDFVERAKNLKQSPFCPYYFCAYQKIYYDYYRDSEFEENKVQAYNLDSFFNSGQEFFCPSGATDAQLNIFALRYRNRSKDYFTAVHPSPLFNGIGMLPNAQVNLSRVKNWLDASLGAAVLGNDIRLVQSDSGDREIVPVSEPEDIDVRSDVGRWKKSNGNSLDSNSYLVASSVISNSLNQLNSDVNYIHHNHQVSPSDIAHQLEVAADGGVSPVTLAQIRSAFALDKLLRVTNRAGKHVDDQMLAQFGVHIPEGISGEIYKIKSYHTMFHIGEVIQSATTVDSSGNDVPLGELAGRGVAVLNGNDKDKFKFKAPCHGILMCCLSVAPRYKYLFGQEKDGLKVYIEDFFKPATDGLGMQPLLSEELGLTTEGTTGAWQYRYMEDKLKFDKASLVFATNSKNPWSFTGLAHFPAFYGVTSLFPAVQWHKVMPYDMNNMFVTQYASNVLYPDSTISPEGAATSHTPVEFLSNYLRDPFTVDFSMQCTKVSDMSTYGEPSLGGI